ncbi:helix-turn-helix transcriptional regulator [Streptomyces sp. NPDC051896]|uniref:helix-turn-helix domain-containing protein n=1 Tax=Streptomyces sp. NPDC051896 TaxID=3155416 RepID=UPI0034299704
MRAVVRVAARVRNAAELAGKGLTVTQLARRAELGRTTVHEALQPGGPVPSHRTVAALAHALGLPEPEELLNLRGGADSAVAPMQRGEYGVPAIMGCDTP